jgi:hypothetical protein
MKTKGFFHINKKKQEKKGSECEQLLWMTPGK